MIGFSNTVGQFLAFYLILFLLGIAGSSGGIFIGSIVTDAKTVAVIVPLIMIPFSLCSGFYKNRWPSTLDWLDPISFTVEIWVHRACKLVLHTDSLVSTMNFDIGLWPSLAVLFGLSIFCRVLSFIFLRYFKTKLQWYRVRNE